MNLKNQFKKKCHCLFTRNKSVYLILEKWADYLISEVNYDSQHLISKVKRHTESEKGIDDGTLVERATLTSDIYRGSSYITIYNHVSTWKKGNPIHLFKIHGEPFLRIDKNKVNQDFLGDIPELESKQASESDEATPEQLARLEELEKQLAELESTPTPESPKSPRGSLPKDTDEELPQELELAPEPISESDEATPEQLARLEELEKQLAELESKSK